MERAFTESNEAVVRQQDLYSRTRSSSMQDDQIMLRGVKLWLERLFGLQA